MNRPLSEAGQVRLEVCPADAHDLETIARMHLEHLDGRKSFFTRLGSDFIKAMYSWLFRWEKCFLLVVRLDGEVAGFTSVTDIPYTLPVLRACIRQALLGLLRRPWLALHPDVLQRLRTATSSESRALGCGIAHVAFTVVLPAHRGLGVGTALKRASIEMCRKRGKRGMLTGVSRNNTASRRLNERCGFEELSTLSSPRTSYFLLRFPEQGVTGSSEWAPGRKTDVTRASGTGNEPSIV